MNKIDYVTPHPPSSAVPVPSYQEATQAQLTIQQTPTPEQAKAREILDGLRGGESVQNRITTILKSKYLKKSQIAELAHLTKQVLPEAAQANGFNYLTSLMIFYCIRNDNYALAENHNEILNCMQQLINKGAPIRCGDQTLMHKLILGIDNSYWREVNEKLVEKLIRFLLDRGLTALDGEISKTPLGLCEKLGYNLKYINDLLLSSIKPSPDNKEKLTYALYMSHYGNEKLLELGADVNLVLPHFGVGLSSFQRLIRANMNCYGIAETIQLCLKYGGDIHQGNPSPFKLALSNNSLEAVLPMVATREVTHKMKQIILKRYLSDEFEFQNGIYKKIEAIIGKLSLEMLSDPDILSIINEPKIVYDSWSGNTKSLTSAIVLEVTNGGSKLVVPSILCQLIIYHRVSPQFFAHHLSRWEDYLNTNFNLSQPYDINAQATDEEIEIAKDILHAAKYVREGGIYYTNITNIPKSYVKKFGQTILLEFLKRADRSREYEYNYKRTQLQEVLSKCIHVKENQKNSLHTIIGELGIDAFRMYPPLIIHCLKQGVSPFEGSPAETPLAKACETRQKKQLIPIILDNLSGNEPEKVEKLSYVLYILYNQEQPGIWERLWYKDDIFLAECLIKHGADPNMQFGDIKETVLHKAIREYDGSSSANKYIECLLKAGARADIMNKDQVTPRILGLLNEQILTRILKYHRIKMHQDEKNALIDYHLATQQEKIEQYLHQLNVFGEVSFESVLERKEGLCYKSKKMGWLVWLIANQGIPLTKIKKELDQQPNDIKEFYLTELAKAKIYN